METKASVDAGAVLQEWRTRVLNGILIVAVIVSLPAYISTLLRVVSTPATQSTAIAFSVLELFLILLAALRKVSTPVRVGGVLAIVYVVAIVDLSVWGFVGSALTYLLVAPVIALILMGKRAGIVTAALSVIIATLFALAIDRSWLPASLPIDTPWTSLATMVMLLTATIVPLVLLYQFQERLIMRERQEHEELRRTQDMLEEQNAGLEEKVRERTEETQRLLTETQQRNDELAILNSVAQAVSQTLDVKAITRVVGDKVREIFDSDSSLIMLLDRETNLIQVPYEYDRNEGGYIDYVEPFPLGTGLSSKVISSGQPLMVGTLEEEIANGAYFPPEIIEKGSGFYSQSWLGVPITVNERVLGLVALADARPYAFTEANTRLLQTLSSSVGVAIENARLFNETQRLLRETEQRAAELSVINSVQQGLASKLDMQSIYDLVGNKIRDIFRTEVVYIAVRDGDRPDLINIPYYIDQGRRVWIDPLVPGEGITSRVIQSGQPVVCGSAEESAKLGAIGDPDDRSQSYLGVPILLGNAVIGVASLQSYQRNAFREADVRLLSTLAASMGVALENARLFGETQRLLHESAQRNQELATINKIQQALVSKLDFQAVIDLFGDEIMRILPPPQENAHTYSVYIALFDPKINKIWFPYLIDGLGNRFTEAPVEIGPGLTSKILLSGEPLLLRTLQEQIEQGVVPFSDERLDETSASWLGVPIRIGDRVIGVFSVQDPRPDLFTESDVRLMTTLAASLGVALENARLFTETQRLLKETEQRAAELATVNTVSAAMVGELDLSALINLVGEQMRSIFKADIAYVALLDEVSNMIAFPYMYGEEFTPIPYGEGIASKVLETGEPVLINEQLDKQVAEIGATMVGRQSRSYLGVPIVVSGKAVGVLSVQSTTQEGVFTESHLRLLATIAANVGIALHNAQLFNEIKRQQSFTQETQRRLADIISFLPDATLVIDREGRVISWNRAMEEMTGIAASDMLGKSDYEYALPFYGERRPILLDLVHMPSEEFEAKYASIQRTGGIVMGETYTPALKGGGRYLYATASALRDANGELLGAIETIRDITDRKRGEEELRKAKAEAEQANQAKTSFLANMSHELRTPLNAIIGFTRIVRRKAEGVLPVKQTENLDKVLVSAEHLLNLINTVLDIAKIEAGRMDVLAANFRIAALIDLCANTAQPLLRPNVVLAKDVDERLGIVHSDQDKIRQIVLNLLSNAAKFTHKGRIVLAARQEAADTLCISVADTGVGISPEALPRIFREFQQADNSTTRQYGGTGLGLAISRNLAKLLGGDISVDSELGKGSTFSLRIPIQIRTRATIADVPPGSAGSGRVPEGVHPAAAASARRRILVVDDDPDAVYLLQESLGQHEFDVFGTRNGPEGLRMARELRPEAILLDIVMPGMDGWQVLNEIKADPATADIPVVLLTIIDKKALGFRLGAAAYLLKPLDPAAVREALQRVISRGGHVQERVLLVDDDPNLADMLRQYLPEAEFILDWAPDGVAGLQAIERQRPDILLLDLLMPRLDGFGVIEALHRDPETRDLPVIVISAKDLTADESTRLRESVSCVLKKEGLEGERLIEEIRLVLSASPKPAGVNR